MTSNVERVAEALAKAEGLNFHERCGFELGEDTCESGTCVAAFQEDHEEGTAENCRNQYRKLARAAIAAMRDESDNPPALSDGWIKAKWPEADINDVKRRFDALMDKLGDEPWRGIPRFPDVMVKVLTWAALLPVQRIEILAETLATIPDSLRGYRWVAEKPYFCEQRVKYEYVVGDNGHGMGRQAIATTPYIKGYNLANWVAAASPGNVGALLNHLTTLQAQVKELEEALATVRQSLKDQASARLDPTMPLLKPNVLEKIREWAEASYAMAEGQEERIEAHGLSLLCDWQDRAREAKGTHNAAAMRGAK